MLDRHALAHGLGAGAHAGRAVDGHEAVGALPGAAQQAAPAVVLEAARERALAAGEQGGGDGVARERLDALAVEGEADRPRAVDALAGLGGQAAHGGAATSSGSAVQCTSLVRVSRSAMNHARQPERWYHHSRWTPATLRRK